MEKGRGRAVGAKFRPGGCQPFLRTPAWELTNRSVPARHGVSVRKLQRQFRRSVGVSPKWVLQRFRLHVAAQRVDAGGATDAAATALELGYFDQAHFINDFRAAVGRSPGRYAKDATRGG